MRPDETANGVARSEWNRRLQAMADLGRASKYQAFKEPLALLGLLHVRQRDRVPLDDTPCEAANFMLRLAEAIEDHHALESRPFSRHLLSGVTAIDPAVAAGWLDIAGRGGFAEGFAEWFAAKLDDLGFAGHHDTPSSVCRLVASLVADPSCGSVYDPACGSGGLLAAAAERIGRPALFGQEMSAEAWAWAEMRFLVRGPGNVRLAVGNALTDRAFAGIAPEGGFDLAVSNPPFGWHLDPRDRAAVAAQPPRYGAEPIAGLPARPSSEAAYIREILGSLSATGQAAVIVPNGFLSRGGSDRTVREALVGHDAVEAVIGLPERLFAPGTTIETAILILKRRKPETRKERILFLDGRGMGKRDGVRTVLDDAAMDRIGAALRAGGDEAGFCRTVPSGTLEETDFSLSPARHVEPVIRTAATSPVERRARIAELDERHAALRQEYETLRSRLTKPD